MQPARPKGRPTGYTQSVNDAGHHFGMSYRLNQQVDTDMPFHFGYWGTPATYITPPVQRTGSPRGWTATDYTSPKPLAQVHHADGGSGVVARRQIDGGLSTIWSMSDIDPWSFSAKSSSVFGITDGSMTTTQTRQIAPAHTSGGTPGRNYLYFDGHATYTKGWSPSAANTDPYDGFNTSVD